MRLALLVLAALLAAPHAAATFPRAPTPAAPPPADPDADASLLPLAAGAGGAAVGASLALGLRALLRRAATVGAPLVALYSRIARGDATRHPVRARLLDAIDASPGASVTDLAARLGLPLGTLLHHLRVLEQHGHAKTLRAGRHRLVFPTGQAADRDALSALAADGRRAVARVLLARPGVHEAGIAAELDVGRSTVHHHLRALEAAGLVRIERGARARCYATPRLLDAL